MSKYSNEFKLEVVQYYLKNHGGYGMTAKHFNIPSPTAVKKWVKGYKEHGPKGLLKNEKSSYSGDFKIYVIEYMHKNHLSLTETAAHFNLSGANRVAKWERICYEKGPQEFFNNLRGRDKNMSSKSRKKKISKEVEEDLIVENQRLRMENEYLKKLNALVQERIKQENKKK